MNQQPLEISVQGAHTVRVVPERATLNFAIGFEATSPVEAVDRTTELVRAIQAELDALRATGAVSKLVVNPIGTRSWRPYSEAGRPLAPRYAASARLLAEFADFKELASFTARTGTAEGVTLGYVGWDVTDDTRKAAEAEALTAAVATTQARAAAIAKAAGLTDIQATQFADPGLLAENASAKAGRLMSAAYGARGAAPMGEAFEISPEDIEITVALQGRFLAR